MILPIYNVENYLPICMNSLLNQTYDNLEFIMVDDGSGKICADMCDSYLRRDTRIVVYHKENGGLSDARNYGIDRAKGDYITCVDPDDYVDVDFVEYLYNLMVKYQAKLSICQHRVHYDNGDIKENGSAGDELISQRKCLERLLYHDVIDTSAWAKLYQKDLFKTVRYPKGKLFEDIGTTYALILQCENVAVGYESKYNYIFHNNSIVNGIFTPAKFDLMDMTDKMGEDVLKEFPELRTAVLRRRVYSRISTLNQMLNVDEHDKERDSILSFINKYGKDVLKNPKAPGRDKIALILLSISYNLYKQIWLSYQARIMNTR